MMKRELHNDDNRQWMRSFGELRDLREETARIDRFIDEEFSRIEAEDWSDPAKD